MSTPKETRAELRTQFNGLAEKINKLQATYATTKSAYFNESIALTKPFKSSAPAPKRVEVIASLVSTLSTLQSMLKDKAPITVLPERTETITLHIARYKTAINTLYGALLAAYEPAQSEYIFLAPDKNSAFCRALNSTFKLTDLSAGDIDSANIAFDKFLQAQATKEASTETANCP